MKLINYKKPINKVVPSGIPPPKNKKKSIITKKKISNRIQ